MISESRKYRKNCGWFTSLVSKEKNLDKLYAKLKAVHVSEYKIIRMCQGTKIAEFWLGDFGIADFVFR